MSEIKPVLPVGLQSFETLRQRNAVYVDKTKYFQTLEETSDVIFCSRPRRFGKTLTVTTLDAYYSGNASLFKGLAVEESISSPDFIKYPVMRLDMSLAGGSPTRQILEESLRVCLNFSAKRHNLSLSSSDSAIAFTLLINDIYEATGKKVVLLIDEYDSPIIKILLRQRVSDEDPLLLETREVMERFYSQIKFMFNQLQFVFITGVTKFSKMGLFSQLNNLVDISLMQNFDAFMGYTEEELTDNFAYFFNNATTLFNMNGNELLSKLRNYYNGFSFDGVTRLYNPFSINYFFLDKKFKNFWIHSGSDKIIRKFLRNKGLTIDQFPGMEVNEDFVSNPGEIDDTPPEGFLYQAGYLSLRSKGGGLYGLDYPNFEVRESLSRLFLQNFKESRNNINKAGQELANHLASCHVPEIVDVLSKLLYGICSEDHASANHLNHAFQLDDNFAKSSSIDQSKKELGRLSTDFTEWMLREKGESFYRSILHAALWMAGGRTTSEKHESVGRLDIEVVFGGITYVFEIKMTDDVAGGPVAANAGMKQIHDRGYGLASDNAVLVSLAIGRTERNIVIGIFEKDGQEMCIIPQQYWKYLKDHNEKTKVPAPRHPDS
ncbi:MAG: ATP-binding protein [Deltaproteobacteria bacterium]|jgi:hypothetical protein|nr:ATP-binding protein [Deltaproteobacteria bacterium]